MKKIAVFILSLWILPALASAATMTDLINAYRVQNGLPEVADLPGICPITEIRMKQTQPNDPHQGFYAMGSVLSQYGAWYENIAREGTRIKGAQGVLNAWIASPAHNANLLSKKMKYVCIKNDHGLWVLTGWSPKIK